LVVLDTWEQLPLLLLLLRFWWWLLLWRLLHMLSDRACAAAGTLSVTAVAIAGYCWWCVSCRCNSCCESCTGCAEQVSVKVAELGHCSH
jgi:hypothetical protein